MICRLIATALLLLIPFAGHPVFGQEGESGRAEEEKIMEAVFRHQIQHCSPKSRKVVYLLSLAGKDPADEFTSRFKDDDLTVKKQSELKSNELGEFIDKETGKPALLLRIDKIKRLGAAEAEVEGSCGAAGWSGEGYKYTLFLEEQKWVVNKAEIIWIA
jgi:hypothetical protein